MQSVVSAAVCCLSSEMPIEREKSLRLSVLDASFISSIMNPADVGKLLSEVIQEERAVDSNLEEMLQRRDTFEELLSTVVQETEEVEPYPRKTNLELTFGGPGSGPG